MAKEATLLQNILTALSGGFNFAKTLPPPPVVVSPRVVSDKERDQLFQLSTQSETPRPPMMGGHSGFMLHAQNLVRGIAQNKIENDRILDMAPEVSQAASIMIPSIISPNDLRNSAVSIVSTCKELSAAQNKKITELVTDYFEKHLSLSTRLPVWIEDALYRSGARPLFVLPMSTLEQELTTGPHVITSQESFRARVERLDNESILGLADSAHMNIEAHRSEVIEATESFGINSFTALFDEPIAETRGGAHVKKAAFKDAYSKVVESVLARETLTIIDNPTSIQVSHTRTKTAKQKITEKTKIRYKESPFVALQRPEPKAINKGTPTFMELPTESVIPIYTPGVPSDHIGYFVMLNEYGHPIEITAEMADSLEVVSGATQNQAVFQQLFQSYGVSDFTHSDSRAQNTMADIYQNIIEAHLHERLTKSGFGNVGIGKDSNVYRYMFARHLQQRRTKLLFVPKDLLTYFCFKHNEYGIGVSKLDELKFILSLRISLIVCRMLVAFNNAIDRKKIEINFDPNFTGNVLEHMRTLQREAMRKSMVTFSHDPMAVSQQIVNKSYTVKARGIPGLPDYDVTSEGNQKSDAAPDEQLSEDLKNLLILKLEVPAAAMNNLGEAEYSRSIVTTNLFFSRSTMAKQKIVTTHLDDFLRKYTTYSADLVAEITQIITSDKHQDNVTSEAEPNKVVPELIEKIIAGLQATLPAPNIAPNKAQFDAIDGMLASLDGILGAVLNDDLANGNPEMGAVVTTLRGLAKSRMVRKYIQEFGFGDIELPNIDSTDQKEILELRQTFINVATALKSQEDLLSTKQNPTDTSSDPNAIDTNFDEPAPNDDTGLDNPDDPLGDLNKTNPDTPPAEDTDF